MKEAKNILAFIKMLKEDGLIINDCSRLKRYLEEKSVYRYSLIYKKLKDSNVNLCEGHLHDFYKYDIRVRRLLYKYLTVYEIKLRGRILNMANTNEVEVENMDFGKLINNYYSNNLDCLSVKSLRNYVMHHRMIQLMSQNEIITGINNMIKPLIMKEKFYKELISLSDDLMLIFKYYTDEEGVKYGMGAI